MAMIKSGTVSVANGNTRVDGYDTNWSSVVAGCLFVVRGSGVVYTVAAPAVNVSGSHWYFTLTAQYAGTTQTGLTYCVVKDFTANYNLPLLSAGDVETATVYSAAMALIETALSDIHSGQDGSTFTQQDHGLEVGTVVTMNNSGVVVAACTQISLDKPIGVVTSVNGATFTIRARGHVENIAQTLTAFEVYYLAHTQSSQNLVPLGQVGAYSAIACLFSTGDHEAIILGFNTNEFTAFGGATSTEAGTKGAVPAPVAGDQGKFLSGAGTWQAVEVKDDSLKWRHLMVGDFARADWAGNIGDKSIRGALMNLNTRMVQLETPPRQYNVENQVRCYLGTSGNPDSDIRSIGRWKLTSGATSWTTRPTYITIPANAAFMEILLIGAGGAGGWGNGGSKPGSGAGGGASVYGLYSLSASCAGIVLSVTAGFRGATSSEVNHTKKGYQLVNNVLSETGSDFTGELVRATWPEFPTAPAPGAASLAGEDSTLAFVYNGTTYTFRAGGGGGGFRSTAGVMASSRGSGGTVTLPTLPAGLFTSLVGVVYPGEQGQVGLASVSGGSDVYAGGWGGAALLSTKGVHSLPACAGPALARDSNSTDAKFGYGGSGGWANVDNYTPGQLANYGWPGDGGDGYAVIRFW